MHGWETRMLLRHSLQRGVSKAALARRFGVSRRTIHEWVETGQLDRDLSSGGARYSPRPAVPHKLAPYTGIIEARLEEFPGLSAKRLFDEVRAAGYPGGYSRVRDYVRAVRPREPVEAVVRFETPGAARGLRLRHDHGSNNLADDFQQEIAFFGIDSSLSFVREPEGNGVAERFIRTLKENLLWVRSFETIEDLRLALLAFKRTYNEQWMLEKYAYRSPAQVRRDLVGLDAAA